MPQNKVDKNNRNKRYQCQQQGQNYRCSPKPNERICREPRRVCNNNLLHTEGNVRYSNFNTDKRGYKVRSNDIPPVPNGPPDDSNLWDLQFCRWWGWNWVRKQEELQNQQRFTRKCPMRPMYAQATQCAAPCSQPDSRFRNFCRKCKSCYTKMKERTYRESPALKRSLQKQFNTPCSSVIFNDCKCELFDHTNTNINSNPQKKLVANRSVSKVCVCKDDISRRRKYKINISKTESWVKATSSSSSDNYTECCRVSIDRISETSTEESIQYLARRISNICEPCRSSSSSETTSESSSSQACSCTKNQPQVIRVCCCCKNDCNDKKPKCECKDVQTEIRTADKQIQGHCKCKKRKSKKQKNCRCKQQEKLIVVCQKCKCDGDSNETTKAETKMKDADSIKKNCETKPTADKKEPELYSINTYTALVDKEQYKSPFTGHLYGLNVPKVSLPKVNFQSSNLLPKLLDKNDNIDIVSIQALDKGDEEHKTLVSAICDAILASREAQMGDYNYETDTLKKQPSTSTETACTVSVSKKHSPMSKKSADIKEAKKVAQNVDVDAPKQVEKQKKPAENKSLLPIRSPRTTKDNKETPQMSPTGLFSYVPDAKAEQTHKKDCKVQHESTPMNRVSTSTSFCIKKTDVHTSVSRNHGDLQLPKIVEETQTLKKEEKSCCITDIPNILDSITASLVDVLSSTAFSSLTSQLSPDVSVKNYVTKSDTEQFMTSLMLDQSESNVHTNAESIFADIKPNNDVLKFVSPLDSEKEICCIEINPPDLKYIANSIEVFKNSISDDGRLMQLLRDKGVELEGKTSNIENNKKEAESENVSARTISAPVSYTLKYQEARNKEKLKRNYYNNKNKENDNVPSLDDNSSATDTDERPSNRRTPNKPNSNTSTLRRILSKNKTDSTKTLSN